jgi:hypothetical protein
MYKTGSVKATIEGKEYVFHFGMNAQDIYQQHANLRMGAVGVLKVLLFAGLMARQEENELPINFSLADVGNLIDLMSVEDLERVKEIAFEALGFMQKITQEMMPKIFTQEVKEAMNGQVK